MFGPLLSFSPLYGDHRVCKRPRGGGQLRAAGFTACTLAAKKNDVLLALRENALFPVSDPIHLPGSVRFTDGGLILLTPRARPWGEKSR